MYPHICRACLLTFRRIFSILILSQSVFLISTIETKLSSISSTNMSARAFLLSSLGTFSSVLISPPAVITHFIWTRL